MVTTILPPQEFIGTDATMDVLDHVETVIALPPILKLQASIKLMPVMVTVAPGAALSGDTALIEGIALTE